MGAGQKTGKNVYHGNDLPEYRADAPDCRRRFLSAGAPSAGIEYVISDEPGTGYAYADRYVA